MNVERFVSERRGAWDQLHALVEHAKGRADRLAPGDAVRMGALYRAAAADLAVARRRFRSEPLVGNLERLVGRSRALVYATSARRGTLRTFLTRDYWIRIREKPRQLQAGAALLLGPAAAATLWGYLDPDRAAGYLPGLLAALGRRDGGSDLGLGVGDQAAISSTIYTNNIRVTLLAFALGITCGIGTAFVLMTNGILLGVVFGVGSASGNGPVVFELVVAHGLLELSCIIVAGAAGLRLGWAIVDPGFRPRADVLREEGRAATEMVLGTAPWLVVAGLVEGFITPAGLGLLPNLFVGIVLGGLFWMFVIRRGAPQTD